ncbi:hypothetical protein GCM10023335_03950 [Streptomyces siamensis]|uniref:Uncharacterized protein n=1 Tax=Streptomyces siamensis TaxID=1274986 RepID=A0ABP9ID66_9ACTN
MEEKGLEGTKSPSVEVCSPSGRSGSSDFYCAVPAVSWGADAGHRSISVGVYSRAPEVPYVNERRGRAVKKLLLVALAAIGGLLVYRQIQADRAEQDLWTEATDSVPTGS